MAIIPKPQFPNVPNLAGVPQLLRSPIFPASPGPVLGAAAALGALWRGLFVKSKWGVFKVMPPPQKNADGIETVTVVAQQKPAVDADSVLEFGYRNEVDVPDYPIQDGGFANYNRVNLPYEVTVRLSKGGSETDRRNFLTQIEVIMAGANLELYEVRTPEKTYTNVTPVRHEISRRGANGAYFLTEVDIVFREIRKVTAQYTNTSVTTQNARDVSAQPVANQGTVNGETPTPEPTITGVVSK